MKTTIAICAAGLLLAAVLFVATTGVEGFAYTIILYFILSAIANTPAWRRAHP